jgi:DNA polymerase III subunit epsilon
VKILGLDYETGGPDAGDFENNFITEVGAVLWDTDFGGPVKLYSSLVNHNKPIDPFIQKYTGISTEMCKAYGVGPEEAYQETFNLICEADYVAAHNGTGFDKPLTDVFCKRMDFSPETPWIDTKTDIQYPETCLQSNLTYLAAFHRIMPGGHRAVFDAMTMLEIMFKYDLDEIIRVSKSPTIKVIADVGFHDKDKAKAAGFYWDGPTKTWERHVKECFLNPELTDRWDFKWRTVQKDLFEGCPV